MWCTCCGEGIGLVIWGAGVWEETFRMSELIWCSSEEWQVTKTALSGTWGVSSAGVCWTLLWFGVLGVELVFNSVVGFSGGVSCPSEVRVFTVLWEWGEAVLFSVADLFSLSLPFCPTASQAESGFSFFSHFRSSFFRWKNSFIIFPSAFVSWNAVVFLVLVWIPLELGQFGILVNSFVDSLGWLLQGEFVAFPWSFHTSLAGSTIYPMGSHEALLGPMTYPSVVQVNVDVHAVHPSDHSSV